MIKRTFNTHEVQHLTHKIKRTFNTQVHDKTNI